MATSDSDQCTGPVTSEPIRGLSSPSPATTAHCANDSSYCNHRVMDESPRHLLCAHPGQGQNEWLGLHPGLEPPPPWPPPRQCGHLGSCQRGLIRATKPRVSAPRWIYGFKMLRAAWSHGPWFPSSCPDTSPLVISLATSHWKCLDTNTGQPITNHCVPLLISCFSLHPSNEITTTTSARATFSSSNTQHLGPYTLDCDFCPNQQKPSPIVHWPDPVIEC